MQQYKVLFPRKTVQLPPVVLSQKQEPGNEIKKRIIIISLWLILTDRKLTWLDSIQTLQLCSNSTSNYGNRKERLK